MTTRDSTVQHSFLLQSQKEKEVVHQKFRPACIGHSVGRKQVPEPCTWAERTGNTLQHDG